MLTVITSKFGGRILTTQKSFLLTLWRSDRPLTAVGLSMLGLLAATAVALVVDPRQITGAPAWLKPAKFAASIAIYTLTLAWVFSYLPEWIRTRRAVAWVTAIALVVEIVLIGLQAWRGVASHFNVGTAFDGAVFSIMGTAIVVQTLAAAAVACALWKQAFADNAMGWALRLGMTISIVGALSAGLMLRPTSAQLAEAANGRPLSMGAHTVGAPDGGPGLPGTGWSRAHGDLRIGHFIGLHALQFLPLLAVLLAAKGWPLDQRTRLILAASISYVAMFLLLLWQALRGVSIMNPDRTTVVSLMIWGLLTAAMLWLASSRRRPIGARLMVH